MGHIPGLQILGIAQHATLLLISLNKSTRSDFAVASFGLLSVPLVGAVAVEVAVVVVVVSVV